MAHTIYPNEVLENKFESQVITALDLSNYCTVDMSMTDLQAGMKKKIITWNYTGELDEVEMGAGNSHSIEVGYQTKEYEVKTTQGRFEYYDEQEMINPLVVDIGLKGLSESFVNDTTTKVVAELEKGLQVVEYTTNPGFNEFVDAVAVFGEKTDGLFAFVSPKMAGTLRKALKDDLKYVEAFVRTGYIGTVCGVPVIVSNAVDNDEEILVATKEAVSIFVKKGSEIEQERDANIRKNSVFARKVALIALTDGTKVVKIKKKGSSL